MSVVLTPEQKEAERQKAQQYSELMGTPYVDPFPEEAPTQTPTPNPNEELSNEALLEILNKRTGAVLSSLDDLKPKPTPEELEAQRQEREGRMLTYGLTSGKFKKEDYDGYQAVVANKIGFIKADITEQIKAANPEMAPEAVEEKVANYLFEHLDPADPLRQLREKELITLSESKINEKYKNIVNLPSEYAQYEEGTNNKATFDRKIQATLPVYTADVNRALESLRTFTVPVPDTKNPANTVNIELGYDDADLKEMADILLSNDQVIKAVKDGYTIEAIKEVADYALWKKHGPRFIAQASKKYNSIQKDGYIAGRKGLNALDSIDVHNDKLEDSIQDVYAELLQSAAVAEQTKN